ncbi:MAG: substrate-binding domain-containing protein [Specibacter sp.]
MLTTERRGLILKELALRGTLGVTEFAARAGISGMTVRRDLAALESEGLLSRVHGGAVAADSPAGTERRARTTRPALATIGMVAPSASYYFPGIIRGAEAAAQDLGVRLVLGVSKYSPAEERLQIQRLLASGVDGLLVTPSQESLAGTPTLEMLAAAAVPVVVVERSIDGVNDPGSLESVGSDHVRGSEIAVNHLLGLGHQRIALCARDSSPTATPLREGYRLALQMAGHAYDPGLVLAITPAPTDPDALRRQLGGILDRLAEAGVTAVIVHNDEDALSFAETCQERGLRIPVDLALVAYDDEIASLGAVPLSAVAPPKFDVGYQALQMCLNRISSRRGTSPALQRVTLAPTLVVRDSTVS